MKIAIYADPGHSGSAMAEHLEAFIEKHFVGAEVTIITATRPQLEPLNDYAGNKIPTVLEQLQGQN